jgi:hypothetical protein
VGAACRRCSSMQQREDEANSGGDGDGKRRCFRLQRSRGESEWARGGEGVDAEACRAGRDSPPFAPLLEPALPYTSGAYLAHATATLLLLLPSVLSR